MDNNFDPKVFNNNQNGDNNSQNNNVNSSFIPKLPIDNNQKNGYDLNLGTGNGQNNDVNSSFSTQFSDEVNKNNNPYRDYLPENRSGNGFNFSPKLIKFGLGMFWVMVICVVCLIGVKYFYGVDVFEVKSRNYNLNLTETVNLDNIYSSPDVVWESDSDNVTIKNNVVFANKTGSAYILGRIGNQQVSDVKINVLAEDAALSLENHSVSLSVGESTKIKVNQSVSAEKSSDLLEENASIVDDKKGDIDVDKNDDISDDYEEYNIEDYEEVQESDDDDNSLSDSSGDSSADSSGDSSSDNFEKIGDVVIDSNKSNDTLDDTKDDDLKMNEGDSKSVEGDRIDLEYKSSDDSVAKVDDEGNITPVSPGTVIITVKDSEGNTDHTYVTVEEDDLVIPNLEYILNKNEAVQVSFVLKGTKYKASDIEWLSNSNDICTVDSDGNLFGINVGTTTVTAKLGNDIIKTINVKVLENAVLPEAISISFDDLSSDDEQKIIATSSLSKEKKVSNLGILTKNSNKSVLLGNSLNSSYSINLKVGDSIKIPVKVYPSNSLHHEVNYVSDNPNIASADKSGNVVAKGVGTTGITVSTLNGVTLKIKTNVNKRIVSVDSISFKKLTMNLEVGEGVQLEYEIKPNNATDKSVQFNYDKNLVSIDENGYLKALKSGVASIEVVSSNGLKSSLSLKITSKNIVEVTKINLSKSRMNLNVGKSSKIDYTVIPKNATDKKIEYLYDNSIVSIDESGNIRALKKGKTTVKLQSSNGVTSSFTVEVTQPKEVINTLEIRDGDFTLSVGKTKKLSVFIEGKNIQNSRIWSSSDTNVLEVDDTGNAIAKKIGQADVILKLGNKSASVKAKVVQEGIAPTSIKIEKTSVTVKMGSSKKISASIKPEKVNNKSVTWKSNNESIAKVQSDGTVVGVSKGTAKVTVFSNDDSNVSQNINVNVTGAVSDSKLSNLENAKSYDKLKIIKHLNMSNLKQQVVIPRDGIYKVGQGFAVTSKYYVAAIVDCGTGGNGCHGENAKILFYNRKTNKLVKSFKDKLGHANGLTVNPDTKKIYVTTRPYEFSYENISTKKSISPVAVKAFKSDINAKSIAYDSATNQYYLSIRESYINSKGDNKTRDMVYIYDSDFNFIKKFKALKKNNQDCSAYKGLFLCGRFSVSPGKKIVKNVEKSTFKYYGAIDIYRVSDGSYLGTVTINTRSLKCEKSKKIYYGMEIEGFDYLGNNEFALYYNSSGHCNGNASYIYTTSDLPIS